MARQALPQLIDDTLHLLAADGTPLATLAVGSEAWFIWLDGADNRAFSIPTNDGMVTVRREQQGNGLYWYAYRRNGPKLRKAYLGKGADLTSPRLHTALATLLSAAQTVPASPVASATIRLRVLGTPQLTRGEQPVAISTSKVLALLAYLALQALPQRREHLLALLWPESAEEAARKNLRNVLWSLRATLGKEVLLVQGERLALSPDVWVDVRVFEQHATPSAERTALQAALDLFRGPLLDGVNLVEAADFDLWLAVERERLTQQFSRAAESLVERDRAAGAWAAVIPVAQRVLAHDPLREWPYRALMEAHAHQGDRVTALRQYELLQTILDRELDLVPEPETEAIHDAIVQGRWGRSAPPPLPRVAMHMNRPHVAPFVGREAERGVLNDELRAVIAGAMRIVVLSGELGIGKSRLWQVWAAELSPAVSVLEARCLLSTQAMPFAPLIALFSHHIWQERFAAVIGATPPAWMEVLSPLLPTLEATLVRPLLSRLQPQDERHRVFEAFVQALQMLAQPPLVLLVDDVQWADAATLDWLDYLIQRNHDRPLLLVLAYRTEDAPRPLLQRIAEWDRAGFVRRLPLDRLTTAEGAALLAAFGTAWRDGAQVYAASAGNPFFLTELVRTAPGDLSPALADLVRARLASLPAVAQQVLQAAAVLEPDIDAATIWRIGGHTEDEILDALDALLQAAVLVEQGTQYAFAHPLVAALVRADLSRARRTTLHRRAAAALEHVYADRLPAQAGRIMEHFREAGASVEVGRYAELAGDYALLVAAPVEAAAFYRQALAIAPTAERQFGLGRAQIWHGDLDDAWYTFEQALGMLQQHGDDVHAAWAALQLADLSTMRGQFDTTLRLAQQALSLAGERDGAVSAAANVLIGTSLRIQGVRLEQAEAHISEAIRLATALNLPDMLTYCYVGLSNSRAERGDMVGAFAAAQEIVRYARQAGNDFYTAVGYNNVAHRALALGDYATAHENLDAGLRLVEARALEVPRQWLYSTHGELALAEGEWDEAERWLRQGLAQAERNGNHSQIAMYHANLGLVARGRRDLPSAVRLLEQARAETAQTTAALQQAQIDLWLAETYTQQSAAIAAEAALSRVESRIAAGAHLHLQGGVAAVRAQLVDM